MEEPSLKFTTELYDPATLQALLSQFREEGYVVLPGIYQRPSLDSFFAEVTAALVSDGVEWRVPDDSPLMMWPALAPRVRQVLPGALSHSVAAPLPCMYMSRWLVQAPDEPDSIAEWHKDREPEGMPGKEYHYPNDVFIGMYFEDMTMEKGPTRIIPRSHRDPSLLPNHAPHVDVLLNKEDGLLLDQRTWHRGTPRTTNGFRILIVYGFYGAPQHYGQCFPMPRAQVQAWLKATTRKDIVYFGGVFTPPNELRTLPTKEC